MSKDSEADVVIDILRSLTFSAEKIPASLDEKRADILAMKDGTHFLIEVKSKADHPSLRADIEKSDDLEVIEYQRFLHRSNTLAGIIKKAVIQMNNTPDSYNSFKIMWFRAIESLIKDEMAFLKATLYGKRHLLVREQNGRISHVSCYYFDTNEFYKFPTLDGVILDNGKELELCVNDFSQRGNEFRGSNIYHLFAEQNSVTDPSDLEAKNQILSADTPIQRKDKESIKRYIETKYNLYVQVANIKSMGGVMTYSD